MMEKIQFDALPFNIEQVEQNFMNELAGGGGGITRRAALAVLSNPSDYYYDKPMDEETGEVFLKQVDSISDYINLLKSHIEMMETARARIFAILGYHFESESAEK